MKDLPCRFCCRRDAVVTDLVYRSVRCTWSLCPECRERLDPAPPILAMQSPLAESGEVGRAEESAA